MDEYFDCFLKNFGKEDQPHQQVAPADIAKYQARLPDRLFGYWKDHGWGGYNNGLFWIVDPASLIPAVEAWLTSCGIEGHAHYHAIARTAFGEIFLWNETAGQTATISPLHGIVYTYPADERMLTRKDVALASFFSDQDPDDLDFDDENEKPLFKKALKKLGRLKNDEMYGFEPALCIGGMPRLGNLAKVNMPEHLLVLAQLGDIEVIHIDVSDHLS